MCTKREAYEICLYKNTETTRKLEVGNQLPWYGRMKGMESKNYSEGRHRCTVRGVGMVQQGWEWVMQLH